MIHSETLKGLTEEELAILFYICGHPRVLGSMVEPRIEFIKMLRLNVLKKLIEVFKQHALEDKKNIFDSLAEKLFTNN